MKKLIYDLLQWTWGMPQTLIGAGVYLKHMNDPHYDYRGARVTEWDRRDGLSLGKFVFVPARDNTDDGVGEDTGMGISSGDGAYDRFLLDHEYGHTIQSIILGPSYLFLVGLPSMIWNRAGYFARKRAKTGRSYYSAVFERTASQLGEREQAQKK